MKRAGFYFMLTTVRAHTVGDSVSSVYIMFILYLHSQIIVIQ